MQSLSLEQLVGRKLGNYQIEQLLGCGSVNAIYMARQQETNQIVMLTIFLLPDRLSAQSRTLFMARFEREAALLTQLHHPHILPVYGFGEHAGFPYLVTPLVTSGSLAKMLKQQQRLSPAQILEYLRQIAAGLDFAHSKGIIHGTLKPANILLVHTPQEMMVGAVPRAETPRQLQIAGFGLLRILETRNVVQYNHPHAHLLSVAGMFLGTPEYTAPEVVKGAPVDVRADIYALGIVLFELLSGKPPFTGGDPFQVAAQHLQQPLPSLASVGPDLPPALDLVIQRALERDPAQRFQSAGSIATAFERVLTVLLKAQKPPVVQDRSISEQPTRPAINWFDDEEAPTAQDIALANTGPHASIDTKKRGTAQPVQPAFSPMRTSSGLHPAAARPINLPTASDQMAAYHSGYQLPVPPTAPSVPDGVRSVDPYAWWSTGTMGTANAGVAGTFQIGSAASPPAPPIAGKGKPPQAGRTPDKKRRRTVALLATGGVLLAGGLGVGGVSLYRMMASMQQPSNNGQISLSTPEAKPTQEPTPTATTPPTPTPSPTPTATPTPSPTPVTGTVIGDTNQKDNSAKSFVNPTSGVNSLLISLGGFFYAFEAVCTHEGAPVKYDPKRQKLVCSKQGSAHGAIFDPLGGANVVKGPAQGPLPSVKIVINADGTIFAGV